MTFEILKGTEGVSVRYLGEEHSRKKEQQVQRLWGRSGQRTRRQAWLEWERVRSMRWRWSEGCNRGQVKEGLGVVIRTLASALRVMGRCREDLCHVVCSRCQGQGTMQGDKLEAFAMIQTRGDSGLPKMLVVMMVILDIFFVLFCFF